MTGDGFKNLGLCLDWGTRILALTGLGYEDFGCDWMRVRELRLPLDFGMKTRQALHFHFDQILKP